MVSRDGKRRMIRAQRAFWMLITLTSSTSGFAPSRPSSGARRVPFHTTTHYLVPDDTAADGGSPKKSPWHHVSNLIPFRRNRRREEDFSKQKNTRRSSIRSMTTDALTERADDAIFTSGDTNTDFVLDNFQRMGPSDVFPKSIEYPLSTETTAPSFGGEVVSTLSSQAPSQNKAVKELEVLIESPSTNLKPATPRTDAPRSKYEGGPLVKRMTRAWFQNFLTGLIERLSIVPAMDLQVRAAPRGSAMKRLIRGQFRCDASIDFRRVIFRNIRMTGGTLEAKRLTLNVLSFLQQPKVRRYLNQFDIHAHNCTFTQDDLFESSCIRNGLGRLLVRILSNAGVKSTNVQVTAVDIVVRTLVYVCDWSRCLSVSTEISCVSFYSSYYSLLARFLAPAKPLLLLAPKCRLKSAQALAWPVAATLSPFQVSKCRWVLRSAYSCQSCPTLTWTLATMLD